MHRTFLLFVAAALLSACAGESRPAGATPPVSYRFAGDDVSAANARADRYCHQFGKRARLDAVKSAGADNVASYRCR
jgi:hypothetical protein